MGMFKEEEHTLFKPAAGRPTSDNPPPNTGGGGGGGYRGGGGGGQDDDERASLGEVLLSALASARRRKGLSTVVTLLCLALTVAAVNLAPRSYVSEGEVLVVKKEDTGGGGWNPDGNKREQLEWEKQIRARSNVENIVNDAKLVERWDAMRQPHRRLLDSMSRMMGSKPPTDDQKRGALYGMLDGRLKLTIDQTTVTISCEWSDPEAARDIVQSAVTRFIDQRYATEIGSIPARIKVLEERLETARLELEKLSPSTAPPKQKAADVTPPSQLLMAKPDRPVDPDLPNKLARAKDKQTQAAAKLQELDGAKTQRVAQLTAQLAEKSASLGPAHPDIVQLKVQLDQAQKDPPDLSAARQAKQAADAEVSDLAAQAGVAMPKVVPGRLVVTPPEEKDKKLDPQVQAKIDDARVVYNKARDELNDANKDLKLAEVNFKIKYTISHPPDVPFTPKKPVGLMVGLGGFITTIFLVLLLAALKDRSTGLFFESQHVRDVLRLPVLGEIKDPNFTA